jgi:hypothetical protein
MYYEGKIMKKMNQILSLNLAFICAWAPVSAMQTLSPQSGTDCSVVSSYLQAGYEGLIAAKNIAYYTGTLVAEEVSCFPHVVLSLMDEDVEEVNKAEEAANPYGMHTIWSIRNKASEGANYAHNAINCALTHMLEEDSK